MARVRQARRESQLASSSGFQSVTTCLDAVALFAADMRFLSLHRCPRRPARAVTASAAGAQGN